MKLSNQLLVISVPLKDMLKQQSALTENTCSGKCKQCKNKTSCSDKPDR